MFLNNNDSRSGDSALIYRMQGKPTFSSESKAEEKKIFSIEYEYSHVIFPFEKYKFNGIFAYISLEYFRKRNAYLFAL